MDGSVGGTKLAGSFQKGVFSMGKIYDIKTGQEIESHLPTLNDIAERLKEFELLLNVYGVNSGANHIHKAVNSITASLLQQDAKGHRKENING
jgi:hypothetical protein